MKKWWKWVLGGLLVLSVCWGWFSRPMGLEEMFPGFSCGRVNSLSGYYILQGISNGVTYQTVGRLDPVAPDEEGAALLEELAAARFSRSLWGTLRARSSHSRAKDVTRPLDFILTMDFSADSGGFLEIEVNYDQLTVSYYPQEDWTLGGSRWVCSTRGQTARMDGLLAYLEERAIVQ